MMLLVINITFSIEKIDPIVNAHTRHQILFFDEHWQHPSTIISYGHDIEAAWLHSRACLEVMHRIDELTK